MINPIGDGYFPKKWFQQRVTEHAGWVNPMRLGEISEVETNLCVKVGNTGELVVGGQESGGRFVEQTGLESNNLGLSWHTVGG